MIAVCRLCKAMVEATPLRSPAERHVVADGVIVESPAATDLKQRVDWLAWRSLGVHMFEHLLVAHPDVGARAAAAGAVVQHYLSSLAFEGGTGKLFPKLQADARVAIEGFLGERSDVEAALGVAAVTVPAPVIHAEP